ncbi:hypothetical protein ACJJTC_001140 [Scirpophaga incertulas]
MKYIQTCYFKRLGIVLSPESKNFPIGSEIAHSHLAGLVVAARQSAHLLENCDSSNSSVKWNRIVGRTARGAGAAWRHWEPRDAASSRRHAAPAALMKSLAQITMTRL